MTVKSGSHVVACSVEPSKTTANGAAGRACERASGALAQLLRSFTILSEETMQAEKRRETIVAQWKENGAELMRAGTPAEKTEVLPRWNSRAEPRRSGASSGGR